MRGGEHERDPEQQQVDHVLHRIGDRPLRNPPHFLQLAGRHDAAGEREIAEQHLGDERDHPKRRQMAPALAHLQVVLGGPDETCRQAAKRVRQRRPLRHGGQRHPRERHADQHSGGDRADDPQMMDNGRVGPRDEDGDRRAGHTGVNAIAGGGGGVHPVQGEDEADRRDDVPDLAETVQHQWVPSRLSDVLNIFSMRSVIRKPLTMLVIDANRAMAPRMRIRSG